MFGEIVKEIDQMKLTSKIDISDLSKGVYIVKVHINDQVISKPILLE